MHIIPKPIMQPHIHLREIEIIVLATITAASLLVLIIRIANAQVIPSVPVMIQNGTFQNTEDGFRVDVPDGWVVEDIDNFHLPNFRTANEAGFTILAIMCPRQEALLGTGGLYNCEQSETSVEFLRDRLGHRPEFESIEDPTSITPGDFLTFTVEEMQGRNYTNIQVINNTDLKINITSPGNPNTAIRTVPAKLIELIYRPNLGLTDMRSYTILATIPEKPVPGLRQVLSGVSISYQGPAIKIPSGSPPSEIQQMFQSIEFIREE
jgi:hypothetical protein